MLTQRLLVSVIALVLLSHQAASQQTDALSAARATGTSVTNSGAADPADQKTVDPAAPAPATATTSAPPAHDAMKPPVDVAAQPSIPKPLPEPTLHAEIDLTSQTMTVTANGKALYTWPISSGTARHATPTGVFRGQWKSKMWYSRKYDNAPMPNAVFFNGGIAVHATYHTSALGQPASHGCIRLAPSNAKAFYRLVESHGIKQTKFVVRGNPKYQAIARGDDRPRQREKYATTSYSRPYESSFFGYSDGPSRAELRAERDRQRRIARAQRRYQRDAYGY